MFVPAIRATAAKEIVLTLNQRIIHIGQGTMNWLENVSKWIFNYDIQVGKSGWTWKKNSKLLISNKTFFAPGLDSGVSSHYIIYVTRRKHTMAKVARKTVEVGKVLKMANSFLAAEHTNADEREAICAMIEGILFETGNYRGYRYLDNDAALADPLGAGSRRFYFPSGEIVDDHDAELRNVNKIRV